jgi:tetratricopeptide (TPR) repeat protein
MSESPLKRLWNAVKPPPPVPRKAPLHPAPAVEPSGVKAVLQSLGPPPAAGTAAPQKRRQRVVILGAAGVILAIAAGWQIYAYISSAPARAQQAYEDGMRLAAKADFTGAQARFTRAVELQPTLAPAYLGRGLTRHSVNDLDGAVADLQRAMMIDPNMAQAHTELGLIYRDRGDLTHAVEEFSRAIQIGATPDAFYQRGELYESLGQHDKAIADYDQAILEQPDSPFVYRARAAVRDELGDHAGAQEDSARATEIEDRVTR